MNNDVFIDASYIADITGRSKSFAYKVMQSLNDELKQKGYITLRGKVSKKYFEERFYGLVEGGNKNASLQR
ncbi:transcriptional regulator [Erysipelotrichaceae bacterium MTC7]|nr:transcriptional regulator [Erysipelotrichaceae bacterium MTC7]